MRGRVPRGCGTLVRLTLSQVTSPSIQFHLPQSQQKLQDWAECEKAFISTIRVLAHVGITFKEECRCLEGLPDPASTELSDIICMSLSWLVPIHVLSLA